MFKFQLWLEVILEHIKANWKIIVYIRICYIRTQYLHLLIYYISVLATNAPVVYLR